MRISSFGLQLLDEGMRVSCLALVNFCLLCFVFFFFFWLVRLVFVSFGFC